MPDYRRLLLPGATYFFTLVTHQRRPFLVETQARQALHTAFHQVQGIQPFHIEAICLLPDHLHCLWSLPENDADYPTRWKKIKACFSQLYRRTGGQPGEVNASIGKKGEAGFWQRRFWEHLIRDADDLTCNVEYIHYNPVKHGLARSVKGWPWSSFDRFVKQGYYPADWGGDMPASRWDGKQWGE